MTAMIPHVVPRGLVAISAAAPVLLVPNPKTAARVFEFSTFQYTQQKHKNRWQAQLRPH